MELKIAVAIVFAVLACSFHTEGKASISDEEKDAAFWNNMAQEDLRAALNMKPNLNVAKNVIFFVGDGMGVSTTTAGRILKGQLAGRLGEEENLVFDTFPHTCMTKTYNVDSQLPDSAGTATAFLAGVKTNEGLLGVTARVPKKDCGLQEANKVTSILHWSLAKGKSVGIVSTARVTHATPAAAYAHSADRDWESDANMVNVTGGCEDIALQLINTNRDIQVILGGGGRSFVPEESPGPYAHRTNRKDRRNLIDEWAKDKEDRNKNAVFLNTTKDLRDVNPEEVDYVFGLFGTHHMDYEVDRDTSENGQPSVAEMTELAINVLKKNEKGFFLFVESGRIDHGHHAGKAARALHEVIAFDKAVETGMGLTSTEDTLTVVTADHSHVFTIGGYSTRGEDILGIAGVKAFNPTLDGLPATTLLYTDGPGYNSTRENLTLVDVADKDYISQTAVPRRTESHGGEDVTVFAIGPMAHLFHGVREQNYIAHVMAYASCVGENLVHCMEKKLPECITSTGWSSARLVTWGLMSTIFPLVLVIF